MGRAERDGCGGDHGRNEAQVLDNAGRGGELFGRNACHVFAQRNTKPFPTPPASAETQNPAEKDGTTPDPQSAKRAALKQNEREFRAVDRLYQLASELKQEVNKTGTTEVFSVQMHKRMEEIEKVAKLLKGRAKG